MKKVLRSFKLPQKTKLAPIIRKKPSPLHSYQQQQYEYLCHLIDAISKVIWTNCRNETQRLLLSIDYDLSSPSRIKM